MSSSSTATRGGGERLLGDLHTQAGGGRPPLPVGTDAGSALVEAMGAAAERCRTHGGHGALMFIDLDNFKTLNDTMGHDVGDTFLKQVANRLQAAIGPQDSVGRIGGGLTRPLALTQLAAGPIELATRRSPRRRQAVLPIAPMLPAPSLV